MRGKLGIYKNYKKQGSATATYDYDLTLEISGKLRDLHDFIQILEKAGYGCFEYE